MMIDEQTMTTLNELIATSREGEYGFMNCADYIGSPHVREILMQRALDCHLAAEELQDHMARLGGHSAANDSAMGSIRRGWLGQGGGLPDYSDEAMLEACERSENDAIARYQRALQQDLPGATLDLINAQYRGVRRNHDEIKRLREQVAAES
ncbi:MAG: PA2169 family four-helix-bundle protein [Betaproteobacteria bacterium]